MHTIHNYEKVYIYEEQNNENITNEIIYINIANTIHESEFSAQKYKLYTWTTTHKKNKRNHT
jgi:hypothetical protein